MKKRFVSMALCLLMLATMLVTSSCSLFGGEEDPEGTLVIDGSTDARAMTISIWGIKGEGTTDEAIAKVEAAMSKLTQAQFNTAIDLVLLEADEYEAKLEERMNEIQAGIDKKAEEEAARKKAEKEAKKRGEKVTTEVTTTAEEQTGDETTLDEFGLPVTLYPPVKEDQLDIFLITDYDMLKKYNSKKVLAALDDQLNGASKLIRSYIHSTLLTAGKMDNKTVAILNQQLSGDYTYMLVNKELVDKYYWDIDSIATLSDAYQFILDVKRDEPEYQPLVGDLSPININYFSPYGDTTIFGHMVTPSAVYGDDFKPRLLFQVTNWSRHIKLQKNLEFEDCIGSATFTPEDKFGVGIMKGNAADVAPYEEDYHVVVLQVPQGTTENIYNGMFAVSTYSADLARSMEIVTYLNTRSDIRNLFGYGIEGEHYEIGEDGILNKISDDYNMKLEYTGNCFIAHAPEGMAPNYWDLAKEHNVALVLSPYFKFEVKPEDLDADLYSYTLELANNFYAALDECTTAQEVEDLIYEYWELYEEDEKVIEWLDDNTLAEEDEILSKSLGRLYKTWSIKNK